MVRLEREPDSGNDLSPGRLLPCRIPARPLPMRLPRVPNDQDVRGVTMAPPERSSPLLVGKRAAEQISLPESLRKKRIWVSIRAHRRRIAMRRMRIRPGADPVPSGASTRALAKA